MHNWHPSQAADQGQSKIAARTYFLDHTPSKVLEIWFHICRTELFVQGDLASRTLVLESKRFYLDVKENKRGRFIKIAEISADGRKGNKDSRLMN